MEAGEKKELLDDQEDDEKAEGGGDEDGDDAVKVAGENKGDVESGDEDDDAEKGALVESPGKKSQVRNTVIQPLTERPSVSSRLAKRTDSLLFAGKEEVKAATMCLQKRELRPDVARDRHKQEDNLRRRHHRHTPTNIYHCEYNNLHLPIGKKFEVLISPHQLLYHIEYTKVLVAVLLSAGWANVARLVEGGRFIETHTACGPVRGTVDGPDQFTFNGIPYAVPVMEADRFTHSRWEGGNGQLALRSLSDICLSL